MPYSEELDAKLARMLSQGAVRRKMFGGTCYLLKGNMVCGVYKNFLILRLGEKRAAEALKQPGVRPFDITGKPMKGWAMMAESALTDAEIAGWIEKARTFVKTLPAK
ncbi:MAG: TfoX/Sxy family protein [Deltaproteobacteria bacterium]|nr:TfoX/Sxy family protein [Deltaproteobacteria bacterium]